MVALELVEDRLHVCLVARIEARRDPAGRPALVDRALLRPRRVRADGRCIDERWNTCGRRRLEDAARAEDVRRPRGPPVVRRLDQPGEVDDAVGTFGGEDFTRSFFCSGRGEVDFVGARFMSRGDRRREIDRHDSADAIVFFEHAHQISA